MGPDLGEEFWIGGLAGRECGPLPELDQRLVSAIQIEKELGQCLPMNRRTRIELDGAVEMVLGRDPRRLSKGVGTEEALGGEAGESAQPLDFRVPLTEHMVRGGGIRIALERPQRIGADLLRQGYPLSRTHEKRLLAEGDRSPLIAGGGVGGCGDRATGEVLGCGVPCGGVIVVVREHPE